MMKSWDDDNILKNTLLKPKPDANPSRCGGFEIRKWTRTEVSFKLHLKVRLYFSKQICIYYLQSAANYNKNKNILMQPPQQQTNVLD